MKKKPNFITDRDNRWIERKKAKKAHDKALNLSDRDENEKYRTHKMKVKKTGNRYTTRLLDEGMVVFSDGSPRSYLKKGVIQEFYDNLSDDYTGYINYGHNDFATDPVILGTWTKDDLTVVDIGDDRKGLDVSFELDDRLSKVKDLKLMDYPLAVSAEFMAQIDWQSMDLLEVYFDIFSSIDIQGFAIVGDPGNISSAGLKLKDKENKQMTKKGKNWSEKFEELFGSLLSKDQKPEDNKTKKTSLADEEELTVENLAAIVEDYERLQDVEKEYEEMAVTAVEVMEELKDTKSELAEAKKELAEYKQEVPSVFAKFKELANDLDKTQKADRKKQAKKFDDKEQELSGMQQALAKYAEAKKALEEEQEDEE